MLWQAITPLVKQRESGTCSQCRLSLSTKENGVYRAQGEDELTRQKRDSTLTFTEVLGAALAVGTVGERPGI